MTAEWSIETGWTSFDHLNESGDAAYVLLSTRLNLPLTKWLRLHFHPQGEFYSARVQERYDADTYSNRLRVREGYVSVAPLNSLELRGGLISQQELKQPLLVSQSRAFPGAAEFVRFDLGFVNLTLAAQQLIPTSYSIDAEREDKEALPQFRTETLILDGQVLNWMDWRASGGLFEWKQLPNKVAFESGLWGNSSVGEVAPGAEFRYGFRGWQGGLDARFGPEESWFHLLTEFRRLQNTAAPDGLNNAQSWGVGPQLNFRGRTVSALYRRFFAEKDATVSLYSSSNLGGTNRMGDQIEFKYAFTDYRFSIVGGWTNAVTIRNNPLQNTLTSYYLGVETDYVSF